MSPAARRTALALGAALAAGLAALALRAAVPSGTAPEAQRPALRFEAGARQAYRLRLDSTLHLAGDGAAGPGAVRQAISGTLHLRVLSAGPAGARVAFQLGDVRATLQGRVSPELDRQLARPFLATFGADGTPLDFDLPPDAGDQARAVLEEAIRTFQLVAPPGEGAAWTTEEEHGAGRYRASYRATRDGRLLKAKEAYLRAGPPGAGGGGRLGIRASAATAFLEPGVSWLARMVVEEDLTASLGEGFFSRSTLRAELALTPLDGALASSLELDAPAPAAPAQAGAPAGTGAPPAAAAAPGRPVAEVARDLEARAGRSAALLYELRGRLLRDPAAAGEVLALLRREVADGTAAALLNALGMAATPEAQAALRAVLQDPAAAPLNRVRAALALGGGTDLDEATLAALREAADGPEGGRLADTAVLALGMAADRLRQEDPERYPGVRDDLLARARRAGDDGRAAVALLALGNARDPALAEVAAARLADPSPAVRDAAAHALGKLGAGADPERLARRLLAEPDAGVRATIAAALRALPPGGASTLALVHDALAREPNPEARYDLACLLGENLAAYPPGRDALAALSTRDPSRRVRQYAAGAVWGRGR